MVSCFTLSFEIIIGSQINVKSNYSGNLLIEKLKNMSDSENKKLSANILIGLNELSPKKNKLISNLTLNPSQSKSCDSAISFPTENNYELNLKQMKSNVILNLNKFKNNPDVTTQDILLYNDDKIKFYSQSRRHEIMVNSCFKYITISVWRFSKL